MSAAYLILISLVVGANALATNIEGVQPASLDQPRVNVLLRREPKGKPLAAGAKDAKDAIGRVFNVEAFLDTGASGFVLSANTAKALGIRHETIGRVQGADPVVFEDVGVGGTDEFHVSFAAGTTVGTPADYVLSLRPKQPQAQYKAITFVVDPETFHVRESILVDAQGNTNDLVFSDVKVNSKIADAAFKWTPPAGVRVIETAKLGK